MVVSGYGNVSWGICKKAKELGAKVLTISGRKGYVYDPEGVSTDEKIDFMLKMRSSNNPTSIEEYAKKFGAKYFPGEKPWGVKADIVMPAATQNEVGIEEAKMIAANGTKYYIEVSNMPTTNEALNYLRAQDGIVVAPSKAANAGGVGVSALEMCQNSERLSWTEEEVDEKLQRMMQNIVRASAEAAEENGLGYDLVAGANIAGFKKVATAMLEQGIF
jgi:glutamate dehydrogenase (NADP+)